MFNLGPKRQAPIHLVRGLVDLDEEEYHNNYEGADREVSITKSANNQRLSIWEIHIQKHHPI